MSHGDHLPQLDGGLFLTDGGIETMLILHEGMDLPLFAAFDLLKDHGGTEALRRYQWERSGTATPTPTRTLNVLGGCCGTDHRHVREACRAWPARSNA